MQGRCTSELDECNMDYNIVKTNVNKPAAAVFISCWVLSKKGGRVTTKLGSKPKKQ